MLAFGFGGNIAFAAWTDKTVGLPVVETISAKAMNLNGSACALAQDKLGRLFIGSNSLLVYDGQSWRAFPNPTNTPFTCLSIAKDGKLWAGAINELGYFEEDILGNFKFHSLLGQLPIDQRNMGQIWACAMVGSVTYFICGKKLLRWDGEQFEVETFETAARLLPLYFEGEWLFQHYESGLYRLSEDGPKLEAPASAMAKEGILGLFRDETGIVTVSNRGFIRLGNKTSPFSNRMLNSYLEKHLVSSFVELNDGNIAIGTLSGGVVLASRSGEISRAWDSDSGLPENRVWGLAKDPSGNILGYTPNSLFCIRENSECTIFNTNNGLKGGAAKFIGKWDSRIIVLTERGAFSHAISPDGQGSFQELSALRNSFSIFTPYNNGILLGRFPGVDWFDGTSIRPVYNRSSTEIHAILPARGNPKLFYISETSGLARLEENKDGALVRTNMLELPDAGTSLHEDRNGHLWVGSSIDGVIRFDPTTNSVTPLSHPDSGKALPGPVAIVGNENGILIFFNGGVLQTGPTDENAHAIRNVPSFSPLEVGITPNGRDALVTYKRKLGIVETTGVGVLSVAPDGKSNWRELDIASLGAIGQVRSLTFSEEENRPILWLGGTEGILRVDYDKVPKLEPPPTPIIRLGGPVLEVAPDSAINRYPFRGHRVRTTVFTGDYARGRDWLIQTRLGIAGAEWTAPANQRSFEFTQLSEGTYQFEARAVNSAGMASSPASVSFVILPPWYRTPQAYAGYAAGLAMAGFGIVRIRETRIRARNRELEILVAQRTTELVKANAAKDDFLASISHEIRNPMNGIVGLAETFPTERLDAESRHKFKLLHQCASHLSALIENILDFSRIQAGTAPLDSKPFLLSDLFDSVVALTSAESIRRGLPVDILRDSEVPEHLVGDAGRVRQILLNFVTNALKYSSRGRVSVAVTALVVAPEATELTFAVADEGPGISAAEQAKLFNRFERGAAAKATREPGTGLGLALCKALAEEIGGQIWLESTPGLGSRFYFRGQFATAAQQESGAGSENALQWLGQNRTALVVDDEEYNRIALADLLSSIGCTVQSVADGEQAVARAGSHDFDLIFIDFEMPAVQGPEIARRLRALPGRSSRALILATTAYTTNEKQAQCLAAGMDVFLNKPVSRERLQYALAQVSQAPPLPIEPAPADRLAVLRRIAAKKCMPLADQLAEWLGDLDSQLGQLTNALHRGAAGETARMAHQLIGLCGLIYERESTEVLRQIQLAATAGRWEEARRHFRTLQHLLAALHIKLASGDRVAPLASAR